MKKISTLMLLGLAFGSIQAAQISQSQALGVASNTWLSAVRRSLSAQLTNHTAAATLRTTFSIQPTAKVL